MKEIESYLNIKQSIPEGITLVAVSKTRSIDEMMRLYEAGQRDFGENRVSELLEKKDKMPLDVRWHLIGHLQTNKVKFIAPFISLIHSIDSEKLLAEVNRQAQKQGRIITCLWQVFVATEDTKFGLLPEEIETIHCKETLDQYPNIRISGIMAMASLTNNADQIHKEFAKARAIFNQLKTNNLYPHKMEILSMGMSSDYKIAIEEGSTMLRIGSKLFE